MNIDDLPEGSYYVIAKDSILKEFTVEPEILPEPEPEPEPEVDIYQLDTFEGWIPSYGTEISGSIANFVNTRSKIRIPLPIEDIVIGVELVLEMYDTAGEVVVYLLSEQGGKTYHSEEIKLDEYNPVANITTVFQATHGLMVKIANKSEHPFKIKLTGLTVVGDESESVENPVEYPEDDIPEEDLVFTKPEVYEKESFNIPIPPVFYKPQLAQVDKTLDNSEEPSVTLQDWEPLQNAYERLRAKTTKRGIIYVPWDVKTLVGDSIRIPGGKSLPEGVSIIGKVGPEGELPRFYCRRDDREGTIAKTDTTGVFAMFGAKFEDGKPVGSPRSSIENIHIDGYNVAINPPPYGYMLIKGNYIHHTRTNGIVMSNSHLVGVFLNLEICGNEISHCGAWNSTHALYLHRALREGSWFKVIFCDNLIHSNYFSSSLKSIANEHIIERNRFYKMLDTGAGYAQVSGSMLIDIPACSLNTIRNNKFYCTKPSTSAGAIAIGLRNRKSFNGATHPQYYDEVDQTKLNAKFHSKEYWESLEGELIYPTIIENNEFYNDDSAYAHRMQAIVAFGTFPNRELRNFGPACLLEPPEGWYERAMTYCKGNIFRGFDPEKIYVVSPPGHFNPADPTKPGCGDPPSRVPSREFSDYFTIED